MLRFAVLGAVLQCCAALRWLFSGFLPPSPGQSSTAVFSSITNGRRKHLKEGRTRLSQTLYPLQTSNHSRLHQFLVAASTSGLADALLTLFSSPLGALLLPSSCSSSSLPSRCGDGDGDGDGPALNGRERPLQPFSTDPFRPQPCSVFLLSCPRGKRGTLAVPGPAACLAGPTGRRSLRLPMACPKSTPTPPICRSSGFSGKLFGPPRWTSRATKQPASSSPFAVCWCLFICKTLDAQVAH